MSSFRYKFSSISRASSCTDLFHVFFGRSHLLTPCGFQSWASFPIGPSDFLKMYPILPQFLLCIYTYFYIMPLRENDCNLYHNHHNLLFMYSYRSHWNRWHLYKVFILLCRQPMSSLCYKFSPTSRTSSCTVFFHVFLGRFHLLTLYGFQSWAPFSIGPSGFLRMFPINPQFLLYTCDSTEFWFVQFPRELNDEWWMSGCQ